MKTGKGDGAQMAGAISGRKRSAERMKAAKRFGVQTGGGRPVGRRAAAQMAGAALVAGMLAAAWAAGFSETTPAVKGPAVQPQKAEVVSTGSVSPHAARQAGQVLISMGQEAGTIYISWTGSRRGPRYLRYADDKYRLPAAAVRKAYSARILKGENYRYKVRLTGLEPGQLYYYEIGDGTTFDSPGFFHAPDETDETVFAYLGDPQFDTALQGYEDWGRLVWEMYKANNDIDFAVTGGDMVNIPTRQNQWNGFLDSCALFSTVPLMTVPGNHEGVTANATYRKIFHNIENGPQGECFYYFDHGYCRFIMLDSSFLTKARQKTMGEALWTARAREAEAWLRRTLQNSGKPWNIIVTHHPVYGLHDIATVSSEIRRRWLPIMEEEGADLVLCGHQHTYMRSETIDGITHVMGNSGGKRSNYYRGFNRPEHAEAVYAAGPNYQIIRATKRKLELTSYDSSNTVIDSFQLEKSRWSELF